MRSKEEIPLYFIEWSLAHTENKIGNQIKIWATANANKNQDEGKYSWPNYNQDSKIKFLSIEDAILYCVHRKRTAQEKKLLNHKLDKWIYVQYALAESEIFSIECNVYSALFPNSLPFKRWTFTTKKKKRNEPKLWIVQLISNKQLMQWFIKEHLRKKVLDI